MGLRSKASALVWVVGACGLPEQELDLAPPELLAVAGQPLSRQVPSPLLVLPDEPLVLDFSEPLDPDSLAAESMVLVPLAVLGPCVSQDDCEEAAGLARSICRDGLCLASQVDEAFRSDAASPPLSKSRRKLVVPAFPEGDGRRVLLRPVRELEPNQDYDLVISGSLRDRAGNGLFVPGGGGALVLALRTTDPYAACVRARLLRPSPGGRDVPRNLPEVLVAATAPAGPEAWSGLRLVQAGGQGDASFVTSWTETTCGSGVCAVGRIGRELPPGAVLELVAERPDAGRSCVVPDGEQSFQVGTGWDGGPPEILDVSWRLLGPCLSVVVSCSEPVSGRAELRSSAGPGRVLAGVEFLVSGTYLEGAFPWPVTREPVGLFVTVEDMAGQAATWGPGIISLPESGPPAVVITEVLANPAGPEPDQEFVEVLNLADVPADLEGWRLVTDPGDEDGQVLPAAVLEPGQFGLLVSRGYDPLQGADPPPDPRALLIRLEGPLSGNGLANSGESLYLLDRAGQVVTAYERPLEVSSSRFNGVSAQRTTGALCAPASAWAADRSLSPTPGAPNPGWE